MSEQAKAPPVLTYGEERRLLDDILNLHRQLVLGYVYQSNAQTHWERVDIFAEACKGLAAQRKQEHMEED